MFSNELRLKAKIADRTTFLSLDLMSFFMVLDVLNTEVDFKDFPFELID